MAKTRRCLLTLGILFLGHAELSAADQSQPAEPAAATHQTSPTAAAPSAAHPVKPDKAVLKCRTKRGGILYDEYAVALHTKRVRNEFTSAQWKTILLQKRVRIPLTAQDHRDMLQFFVHE